MFSGNVRGLSGASEYGAPKDELSIRIVWSSPSTSIVTDGAGPVGEEKCPPEAGGNDCASTWPKAMTPSAAISFPVCMEKS
ncbi:hypothetical protein GCM10007100_36200 [Roseibacillus persicicus]|uniref:Uncharacterized protein n=1 Tax=Roseibacillus persicicus TaxID=454148 RepID=A0A918TYZ7_9BACT|nr:hypothetical protein GCM10007100_36200 [Roseibacillus persicicus]